MLVPGRPLVLVHGLWDSPKIFRCLLKQPELTNFQTFTPYLPHGLGSVSLFDLATELDRQIVEKFGGDRSIDLLGFSMGGVVGRIWLQEMGGASRTRRFFSVGTPHHGTFLAQMIPSWLLPAVSDMKRGSSLLNRLNSNVNSLRKLTCMSFFCRWDLMVIPGWQAVLSIGKFQAIPVLTHKQLITHKTSMKILLDELTTFDV